MGEHDRITPYNDRCTIKERIDEIVASDTDIHIEMMNGADAWMRVGDEVFWIHAQKGKLVIRHAETRKGYSKPLAPSQENSGSRKEHDDGTAG